MKRIFYFNITYGCNSNCVFCYSHNTKHNGKTYNEIDIYDFLDYLIQNNIKENDRVIINGGEPLLHTHIQELLNSLVVFNCEVLIYTNGRLLRTIDYSMLNDNYRFIVPIHGYSELHDSVTNVKGSYYETINGMEMFKENNRCKLDIKVILNNGMIKSNDTFYRTVKSFENIYFNNAIHLTKMADTIISTKNNCVSIDNETASKYINFLFLYFRRRKQKIKIFDACVKDLTILKDKKIKRMSEEIEVFFKDANSERKLILEKPHLLCMDSCDKCDFCMSAVGEYKVLEFYDDKIYEELE